MLSGSVELLVSIPISDRENSILQPSFIAEFVLTSWEGVNWDVMHSPGPPSTPEGPGAGGGGGNSRKIGWGCAADFLKHCTYPISDQNLLFSLPYFRHDP